MLFVLGHVALPDIELEESCIEKINSYNVEAEFEGKSEAFGNVHACGCQADLVRCECHYGVTAKEAGVQEQVCDVVESLILQYLLPDERLFKPCQPVVRDRARA